MFSFSTPTASFRDQIFVIRLGLGSDSGLHADDLCCFLVFSFVLCQQWPFCGGNEDAGKRGGFFPEIMSLQRPSMIPAESLCKGYLCLHNPWRHPQGDLSLRSLEDLAMGSKVLLQQWWSRWVWKCCNLGINELSYCIVLFVPEIYFADLCCLFQKYILNPC